jgi:hypothetical protein
MGDDAGPRMLHSHADASFHTLPIRQCLQTPDIQIHCTRNYKRDSRQGGLDKLERTTLRTGINSKTLPTTVNAQQLASALSILFSQATTGIVLLLLLLLSLLFPPFY